MTSFQAASYILDETTHERLANSHNFLPHMVICKMIGHDSGIIDCTWKLRGYGKVKVYTKFYLERKQFQAPFFLLWLFFINPKRGSSFLAIGSYLGKSTYFVLKVYFGAQKCAKSIYWKWEFKGKNWSCS